LKRRGVMNNPELREVIKQRLGEAQQGKRVAAMKTLEAAEASGVDQELAETLKAVGDAQLKAKGRIERPTALLIDKSGSMNQAIEIGKRIGSMISAIMDANFYAYAFDVMPYAIQAKAPTLEAWESALKGIKADGGTSCGCGIAALERHNQYVEQIIMVTDEGENQSPPFLGSLDHYCAKMNVRPTIFMLRCGDARNRHRELTERAKRAGYEVQDYDFDGDYYSLPNLIPFLIQPSKLDLLMEIMDTPLPVRKAA